MLQKDSERQCCKVVSITGSSISCRVRTQLWPSTRNVACGKSFNLWLRLLAYKEGIVIPISSGHFEDYVLQRLINASTALRTVPDTQLAMGKCSLSVWFCICKRKKVFV